MCKNKDGLKYCWCIAVAHDIAVMVMRNEKSILKYQIHWLIYQTYWQYMILDILQKKYMKNWKKGKTEVFQVYSWYIGKYWKLIRKFQNNKIMKSGLHENISWYLGYWWDIVLTGPCQYRCFWNLKPSDQVQGGRLYQWE